MKHAFAQSGIDPLVEFDDGLVLVLADLKALAYWRKMPKDQMARVPGALPRKTDILGDAPR